MRFRILGFPVYVHPFFFLVAALLGGMQNDLTLILVWVAVVFVSVLAHELGHALLHKQITLHRDRPLEGPAPPGSRSPEEGQADKFASYFLMPKDQVRKIFEELFLTDRFVIDDETAFALTQEDAGTLRARYKNLREFTRALASAKAYDRKHFNSISELFGVSVSAMAIRLEELDLVEFSNA